MTQTTLLTSHKGVDLHAATAVRVMQRRLEGGDALVALRRCELHTFDEAAYDGTVDDLLAIGRYYNPNKHHYGHFESAGEAAGWADPARDDGADLGADWPGKAVATDLATTDGLLEALLGGTLRDGLVAVDVVALPRGDEAVVRTGVLWRLVMADDGRAPQRLAERLAVARGGDQGLLVNPHLDRWLVRVHRS